MDIRFTPGKTRQNSLKAQNPYRAPTRSLLGKVFLLAAALCLLILAGCALPASGEASPTSPVPPAASASPTTMAVPESSASPTRPQLETPVQVIQLEGPASHDQAQFSGMAWLQDELILLPQYPNRMSADGSGIVFAISRQRLLDTIQGRDSQPIRPREIRFDSAGLEKQILLFEGFEAIAFQDLGVFLTIEARSGINMVGYLVKGEVSADFSEIRLDPKSLSKNPPQARQQNRSDEAIVIADQKILTFFESNGAQANPGSYASVFDMTLKALERIDIPALEYRLTDATPLDASGNFWVINYFYPGDKDLKAQAEPLAEKYGIGATHNQYEGVERLVEFHYSPGEIVLYQTPPIQLELDLELGSRNWEGLVRLDDLGFLLITDEYPTTILGFVPYP